MTAPGDGLAPARCGLGLANPIGAGPITAHHARGEADISAHELSHELDVQRARTQMKTTRSRVPGLRAAIHAAAFRIAVLTGRQPAALLDELVPPRPIPAPPEMVPVGLPSELPLRRPDVRRAEREERQAEVS